MFGEEHFIREVIIILIDCKNIANEIKEDVRKMIVGNRSPRLYVIQVGDNPASNSYINGKKKDCEEVGIECIIIKLDENISEDTLCNLLDLLACEQNCDGIIVQLPLPDHIHKDRIISHIPPEKDVDGFRRDSEYAPCTPLGIVEILKRYVNLTGKDCLIINRSDIVGKPLVNLLLNENATVIIAHSKTQNLKEKIKQADIIITAVGIPNFITKDMVMVNKIYIDVSMNKVDGKLCGDISKDSYDSDALITPVPGGVGLFTRAMLLNNVLKSYKRNIND